MASKMKIYPSGFLGSASVQTTEPLTAQDLGRRLFEVAAKRTNDTYTASMDVMQLWEGYRSDAEDIRSFEFLEKVITVAKPAFGTRDFHQWIKAQVESPFITPQHIDYIDDLLGVIYEGRHRRYQYTVWQNLLVLRPDIGVKLSTSPTYLRLFDRQQSFSTIEEVLRLWLAHGGVRDVVESLYILFGSR
jgi:hypothetical protein